MLCNTLFDRLSETAFELAKGVQKTREEVNIATFERRTPLTSLNIRRVTVTDTLERRKALRNYIIYIGLEVYDDRKRK